MITYRIVRLLELGVHPRNILGLTFTNKAATEMASRVRELRPNSRAWIGTFHRFCARLLRERADVIGLRSNFSILDASDQRQLVRDVLIDLGFDTHHYSPDKIGHRISRAKNEMLDAQSFAQKWAEMIGDYVQTVTAQVYTEYQRRLLQSNAVDFDDLLLHVVRLLSDHEEIRSELNDRYRYLLVDEYQDTNLPQYRIVTALSFRDRNVCVTGDPDQSIYGWRGAQIGNILRFEADFPGTKVVRLEQNFRSTPLILRSADRLISHNRYRKPKALLTDRREGPPVELCCCRDGAEEAEFLAQTIRRQVETGEAKWSDFAIFYRVNSLSREIELSLLRRRVPFQVAAGVAFYERAEVKDLVAYLRLLANPADNSAFLRVVNRPRRGIGKKTLTRLVRWAESNRCGLWEAARTVTQDPECSKRAAVRLKAFADLLDSLSLADAGSIERLLHTVIDRTGYARAFEDSTAQRDLDRLAIVNELLTAAGQYERVFGQDASLEGFLESASLCSDVDSLDESSGKVTLMTLHAAKGLEFPTVFIVGVEQNLLPHERALRSDDPHEYEEERRLLFVGMTRAMSRLYLTKTERRSVHGRFVDTIPSPFLSEMEYEVRDCTGIVPDEDADRVVRDETIGRQETKSRQGRSTSDSQRPLLTTGAALLNGDSTPVELPRGTFGVGAQVRHPRYGLGTVVDVGGFSRNRTLTVEFHEDSRRETFVADKSPLQPIGIR